MKKIKNPKIISIIPARGGSKSIPKKNIFKLLGKPMICHSIKSSLECNFIDRTIVSTDDLEIAKVAQKHGAEIPILRPKYLGKDSTLDLPVFEHMVNYLIKTENYKPDFIFHLRPTSPFRKKEWLDNSIIKILKDKQASSLRSVSIVEQHPYRVFDIKNRYLDPFVKLQRKTKLKSFEFRRQDWPKLYYYNCVIDIIKTETLLKKKSMTGNKIIPFIIDSKHVFDIDGYDDLNKLNYFLANE